ncbi:MAG: 30S ribosomal protein S12 methylthiotransferase RimO [Defluviitaleaceae bacterium]|nr:30S ribosomal protein S12 methylthiotransferase RimO [Defluviitaleaceae bacterium]
MVNIQNTKVALISLGCDKNTVDSEMMLGMLAQAGAVFTPDLAQANIIIINTCGFLQDAVAESKEEIEAAIAYKKAGTCRAIVVTGCAAVRHRADFEADENIDIVLGVSEYDKLIPLLVGSATVPGRPPAARVLSTPKHYAYLRIAEGCNKHCTYCTIPQIRGAYESRPMPEILSEAEYLARLGVKELILIAQDTTLYGTDLGDDQQLHALLNQLSKIDGIKWIRLLYCYPEHIYDDLITEIAINPKVLPYIDMPIQHASDKILKLMNRQSSAEILREKIAAIRAAIPHIALRTTLIVGFPDETKKDFQDLCDFVEEIKFDNLGVFPYSREEGTSADKMDNHLEEKTKLARRDRLMKIQQQISADKLAEKDGRIFEVVIEGEEEQGVYFGRMSAQAPDIDGLTFVSSPRPLNINEIVRVQIIETWEYDMMGELYESAK